MCVQVGNGANMKLVVNMIMGAFMVSSAEGLELAKGVGLKEEDLIEVVNMAAIATPMFKLKVGLPGLAAAALITCRGASTHAGLVLQDRTTDAKT